MRGKSEEEIGLLEYIGVTEGVIPLLEQEISRCEKLIVKFTEPFVNHAMDRFIDTLHGKIGYIKKLIEDSKKLKKKKKKDKLKPEL